MNAKEGERLLKAKELRMLSDSELQQILTDCYAKLQCNRFAVYERRKEKVDNPGQARNCKKTIARIKTIFRERKGTKEVSCGRKD